MNLKITELNENTNPQGDVLIPVVTDPGGTPETEYTTKDNFLEKSFFTTVGFSSADYIVDGADDHVQIQQAIDAAVSVGGGTVFLRRGAYQIGASIALNGPNVHLVGDGWATELFAKNGLNANVVNISGTGTVGVQVRNLAINGNRDNQTSGHGISLNTPYSTTDTHHLIRQVDIRSIKQDGVVIGGDTRVVFLQDIRVRNIDGTGYTLAGSDHIINSVIADDCKSGGFNFSSGSLVVNDSKAFFCGQTSGVGWYIVGLRGKYTNCSAQDNFNAGWLVDGASNVSFVNCTADSNGRETEFQSGFQINNSNNINLNGGIFVDRDTGATYRQLFGVNIVGTSNNCVVTYPVFDGNIGGGFSDTSSGTNYLIENADIANRVDYLLTSEASSATPTPTGNAQRNELIVTALAENCTIAAPTGTPAAGNMLKVIITASGGTRTVGYNAALTAGNVTRTTSVPSGKTLVQVYQYQNATWKCHYDDLEA
jgi:hypothetical protein